MIDGDILKILQQAVTAAVEASMIPTLPVKFYGRTFDPEEKAPDGKYLETVFIPNNPTGGYWGDEKDYMGMYRLILHWPNKDEGVYDPLDVLKSICSYFTKDRFLQIVKISDIPTLSSVQEIGSELLFPASLRYQSFNQGT
jgi:hypothetical protein